MRRKRGSPGVMLCACLLVFISASCSSSNPTTPVSIEQAQNSLTVDGTEREYHIHVPAAPIPAEGWPLLIALHGLGGNSGTMSARTNFNAISDRKRFIVVYPDGLDRAWIDAGGSASELVDTNVRFIDQLIDALDASYKIDDRRIFATGISNGALFAFHLACHLSNRIAAIGVVAGASISRSFDDCNPGQPVAYIALHGTMDFVIPYEGGMIVDDFPEIGYYQSAPQAAEFWAKRDGCDLTPIEEAIQDRNQIDGSTITRQIYSNCLDNTTVELYSINGAGHTWPGHPPASRALGDTNLDIDTSEVLWNFFKSHPRSGGS